MRVSELAQEYNTTDDIVLSKLKSLKLKAKDGNQELNKAVVVVLRSELNKGFSSSAKQKVSSDIKEQKDNVVKKKVTKAAKTKKEKVKKLSEETDSKDKKETTTKKKVVKRKTRTSKTATSTTKVKKKTSTKTKKKEKEDTVKVDKDAQDKAVVETTPADDVDTSKKAPKAAEPFVPLKPLLKKKKKAPPAKDAKAGTKGVKKKETPETPDSIDGEAVEPSAQPTGNAAVNESPVSSDPSLKSLEVKVPIAVKDFAVAIQQKTGVVLKKLMQLGVFANINQNLDEGVVRKLAAEFGFNLTKVKTQEQQLIEKHLSQEESPELSTSRAPVVTFMGHVDHGKTSLLDRIRSSSVTDKEHGGITQHIGAYTAEVPNGKITFLDTPGHEAFTAMRARGAHITDLVVVVIAADEGIMPQTEEAIDHARAADVPIVIALNKIDRRNADVEMVKKQLMEKDLTPEDWGGKTICVGVSALTGEGVDNLLEMILLEAELLELKANAKKPASGIVVEAHLSRGKGAVASLIVQSGTLSLNDIIVVGPYHGKIKALFNDHEKPILTAGPSTPVEVLGLPGVPEAGEMFYVVQDEKQAREITMVRQMQLKNEKLNSMKRISLEDLYSQIQEGTVKELSVILKADVQGSLEALKDSLLKIPSEEVKVKVIHSAVGEVNASDVILAVASNAIIIGFHVGIGSRAKQELDKQFVDVRLYRIIYDAVNDVRKALEGLLEPKKKRRFLSRIEVRQVFKLSKAGMVAGCYVLKGKVFRKSKVDIIRNDEIIHSGIISTLKRFKDDVREVAEGYECGIVVDGFSKIESGDILEAYEVETIARTL